MCKGWACWSELAGQTECFEGEKGRGLHANRSRVNNFLISSCRKNSRRRMLPDIRTTMRHAVLNVAYQYAITIFAACIVFCIQGFRFAEEVRRCMKCSSLDIKGILHRASQTTSVSRLRRTIRRRRKFNASSVHLHCGVEAVQLPLDLGPPRRVLFLYSHHVRRHIRSRDDETDRQKGTSNRPWAVNLLQLCGRISRLILQRPNRHKSAVECVVSQNWD